MVLRCRIVLLEEKVMSEEKSMKRVVKVVYKRKHRRPIYTAPLVEGYVVKGGRNQGPSQIKERPAAPGAIYPQEKKS